MTVTSADGSEHDSTVRYVHHMDGRAPDAEELAIPGVSGAAMKVMAVSPSDGSVIVRLGGLSKGLKEKYQLSVEVTEKPLISLVWAGFYVMMAGADPRFRQAHPRGAPGRPRRRARKAARSFEARSPGRITLPRTHPLDDSVGRAPVVG